MKRFEMVDWFQQKNFTENEIYAIEQAYNTEVERETEKALLIKWYTDFGKISRWVPKKCVSIIDDDLEEIKPRKEVENVKTELTEEKKAEFQKIFESTGLGYNWKLVKFAKENGVKGVYEGLKTETLIKKIKNAGLEVPAR